MTVVVNGDEREVAAGAVVADLVARLDLKPERVAVELNRRILKRQQWGSTLLSEGDKVEIVHFVGGGEH
ncbi:MAG TPA: sulfur carrier protein ThiS [Blastocatellia bacterium]|nr:sulfur carrier protein ThiS [Blastocatellia bacterium]